MKYRAIIFDLFGTLVENLPSHQYMQILVVVTNLLSIEQDGFINLWLEYSDERMMGQISNADCLNMVCRKIGLDITEEQSSTFMRVFADQVSMRLVPSADTLSTLSNLSERAYKVGLISNCSDEVPSLWESSPLSSVVHEPVFSCSVGVKKPDPEIYLMAAEKTGAAACECIFVDDSVEFLVGARKAGLTGVLIHDRTLNSSFSNTDKWDGYKITSPGEMEILLDSLK